MSVICEETLAEIDRVLGVDSPPAVEYIFVEPFSGFQIFGIGIPFNAYGHAALRYTRPNGEQHVVNITGDPSKRLVEFMTPAQYFFGSQAYSDQGGIRSRSMVTVRVEEYDPELIEDMHHYFDKLKRRNSRRAAQFSLIFAKVRNAIGWVRGGGAAEFGNCAYFTSRGLVEGDLLAWPTIWPKSIWISIFEEQAEIKRDNVHVVSFRRLEHETPEYGVGVKPVVSGVGVFQPLRSWSYAALEEYADVVVRAHAPNAPLHVVKQDNPVQPSWFRHHRTKIALQLVLAGMGALWLKRRLFPTPGPTRWQRTKSHIQENYLSALRKPSS